MEQKRNVDLDLVNEQYCLMFVVNMPTSCHGVPFAFVLIKLDNFCLLNGIR